MGRLGNCVRRPGNNSHSAGAERLRGRDKKSVISNEARGEMTFLGSVS
jgi:hypothetical protein